MTDTVNFYGTQLQSRFLIGTALYPSPQIMIDAIKASQSQIITVSLRRQNPAEKSGETYWDYFKSLNCHFLPNTAGCHSVQEAVTLAQMACDLFETNWVKLEVIGDDYNLQPDPFKLLEATEQLLKLGFNVFPYCTDDLVLCQHLYDMGCKILMPWASPIGTGKGVINPYALMTLRERLPDAVLIVDAGLGKPSDATKVMEMGFDAVLLNTAVAKADDPVLMADAFRLGIEAGRKAYLAGVIAQRQTAAPSTPVVGMPFWHQS